MARRHSELVILLVANYRSLLGPALESFVAEDVSCRVARLRDVVTAAHRGARVG